MRDRSRCAVLGSPGAELNVALTGFNALLGGGAQRTTRPTAAVVSTGTTVNREWTGDGGTRYVVSDPSDRTGVELRVPVRRADVGRRRDVHAEVLQSVHLPTTASRSLGWYEALGVA